MSCNKQDIIARGTTPTLVMRFNIVDPSLFATAFLTIEQTATNVEIEKSLSEGVINGNVIEWTLTQEETLRLSSKYNVKVGCRWRLMDGTTGKSPTYTVPVDYILKDGVI